MPSSFHPLLRGLAAALAIAGAGACAVTSDPAAAAESAQRESEGALPSEEAVRDAERALAERRERRAGTDAEPEVGGFVQISDDQLANNHVVFATFFGRRPPTFCGEFTPLEGGGECFVFRPCTPPAPPFEQPEPVTVGPVEVKTAFDTVRLEPLSGTFYPRVVRSGPFWRGDGDFVSVSFPGVPGQTPAFSYRERAPVGDVIASIPSPFSREAPVELAWNYADGSEAAVGDLLVRFFQREAGAQITCRAPLALRAIAIPPAMLTRFRTGPANLILQSVAVGTGFLPLEQGNVRLSFQLSSVVDMGDHAPDPLAPLEPNVSFE